MEVIAGSNGMKFNNKASLHWQLSLCGNLFDERIEKGSIESNPELLSITIKHGIIKQSELMEKTDRKDTSNSDKSNYKTVRIGDLSYNKMRMWQGAIGVADCEGIVSPAYVVLKPKKRIFSRYFYYQFKTPDFINQANRFSYGLCDDMNSLRYKDFRKIPVIVPSYEDQVKISFYLDRETSRIDSLISKKEHLIELLNEKRQALISHATTRGLKSNIPMKDSKVEWLGMVPEHWKGVLLKRLSKSIKTGSTPQGAEACYFSAEGFNWYTPGDFQEELFLKESGRQLSDLGVHASNIFPEKTVMMIGIGATIGKVSVTNCKASCNQQINAIVTNEYILPEFLAFYLRSIKDFIVNCGKYTTMPILNQEETKKLPVFFPTIAEQKAIVSFLDYEIGKIDTLVFKTQKTIELFHEKRSALITAAVKGQIDIQGIV